MRAKSKGMSLVGVLMAMLIVGILAVVANRILTTSFSGIRRVEQRGELESIRQLILEQVDCSATFELNKFNGMPIDPSGNFCDTENDVQKPAHGLILYRNTAGGPKAMNKTLETKAPFKGSFKFGDWFVRATCSKKDSTLVIRAARGSPDGKKFARDPMTKEELNWSANSSLLIGGSDGSIPVCYGKGVLTGDFTYVERVASWVGTSGKKKMDIGKSTLVTGDPKAFANYFQRNDDDGKKGNGVEHHAHGTECKKGWQVISCTMLNNFAVSDGVIRAAVADPNFTFWYDNDVQMNKQICSTNEFSQVAHTKPDVSGKITLRTVCAKVN